MKTLRSILALAAALVTGPVLAGFTSIQDLVFDEDNETVLSDGVVYRVRQTTTIDFSANHVGKSPIVVPDGVKTALFLDDGVTLTVIGANASGTKGATAGVRVGGTSELYVTGGGRLVARGGAATNGESGLDSAVWCRYPKAATLCGWGGAGGTGGGGGAAAIGGNGGNGGNGGAEVKTEEMDAVDFFFRDFLTVSDIESTLTWGNVTGKPGTGGTQGGSCGTVGAFGDVTIHLIVSGSGNGGGAGLPSGGGDVNKAHGWFEYNFSMKDQATCGAGGGGGGGGGGGMPDVCIGGGGGGGGGGGSGGTGTTCGFDEISHDYYTKGNRPIYCDGQGGKGGLGRFPENAGATGGSDPRYSNGLTKRSGDYGDQHRESMAGGSAGSYGGRGANGSFYLTDDLVRAKAITCESISETEQPAYESATVLYGPDDSQNPKCVKDAIIYTVTLFDGTESTKSFKVYLGDHLQGVTPPTRAGFTFGGYFTGWGGTGTQLFKANGSPVDRTYRFDLCSDVTLYAYWSTGRKTHCFEIGPGENVTFDGQSDGGTFTQEDSKPVFTIRRGGTLTVRNLTVEGVGGSGLIYNEGTLYVSNCVFRNAVTVDGWGGVYSDRPLAKAVFYACTFENCWGYDAGVIAAEGSEVSAVNCTFHLNRGMLAQPGLTAGAAVSAIDGAKLDLVSCTFVSNSTAFAGTGAAMVETCANNAPASSVGNCVFALPSGRTALLDGGDFGTQTSNLSTTNAAEFLSARLVREVRGVQQGFFKPYGKARTEGCATTIHRRADWHGFSYAGPTNDCDILVDGDQVGQYPLEGYAGARTGNTLQYMINCTPDGGTLFVPSGLYDPVTVNKSISVFGEDPFECVIDACLLEPCVTLTGPEAADLEWYSFTFQNGWNVAGDGGGWQGPDIGGGWIMDCVFSGCTATNGGAVAHAMAVSGCVIAGCAAAEYGGGTYDCALVERTYYSQNTARYGGASSGDGTVRTSILDSNKASERGGAAFQSILCCDTLADNSSDGNAPAGHTAFGSTLQACLLYNNALASDDQNTVSDVFNQNAAKFLDAAKRDFHLRIVADPKTHTRADHSDIVVADENFREKTIDEGWLDFDGYPLVSADPFGNKGALYAGCYTYSPYKTHGLMVTGTDSWYDEDNDRTSLREAIEEARRYPWYAKDGEFVVTFDPAAFSGRSRTIKFDMLQIEADAFSNATLVIRGPEDGLLTIDGAGTYRAFRVKPGNSLRLENLVLANCLGQPVGIPQASSDGGAVLNAGRLVVSNCLFRGNCSGSQAGNKTVHSGGGGALATLGGATTTVWRTSFVGNVAALGGALFTFKNGRTDVFFSTFDGNSTDCGSTAQEQAGGAVALDTKITMSTEPLPSTLLANCTFSGNRVVRGVKAGGAVKAYKGLVLLNSVLVGNTSQGAADDISIDKGGTASFLHSAYGVRKAADSTSPKIAYTDEKSTGGYTPADLFADEEDDEPSRNGGLLAAAPAPTTVIPHSVFRLKDGVFENATQLWTTKGGEEVGYGDDSGSIKPVDGRGTEEDLKKDGSRADKDILGVEFDKSVAGSLADSEPVPVPPDKVVLYYYFGNVSNFTDVAEAVNAARPGDDLRVAAAGDAETSAELGNRVTPLWSAYAQTHDWFDFRVALDGSDYALKLTERAYPTVTDFILPTEPGGRVLVKLADLRQDLWYCLGHTNVIGNVYLCDYDGWVQADADGVLRDRSGQVVPGITAPMEGEGFDHYTVIIAPYAPDESLLKPFGISARPGGEPTEDKVRVISAFGETNGYASVREATAAARPGDTIEVCDPNDTQTIAALAESETVRSWSQAHADWYDFTVSPDGTRYALRLNAKATPEVGEFTLPTEPDGRVFVGLSGVKEDLWYSLGYTTELGEDFEHDSWAYGDSTGKLHDESGAAVDGVTAPLTGKDRGFYRVDVAPYKKEDAE